MSKKKSKANLRFEASDFAGIQTGFGCEFLDEAAATECAQRANERLTTMLMELPKLQYGFIGPYTQDWTQGKVRHCLKKGLLIIT